jgi:photosystem II stability/assembly factor-like uncharacterized protein
LRFSAFTALPYRKVLSLKGIHSSFLLLPLLIAFSGFSATGQSGWSSVQRGLAGKDLNAVYFADSKTGWIAGDDGFVGRTADGGVSWVSQKLRTSAAINDIYFRNKDDGYLVAGGKIWESEDGGVSWAEQPSLISSEAGGNQLELYSVRFTSKKRGWVVGSLSRNGKNGDSFVVDNVIFRTTNAGESWDRQKTPNHEELIHLDFVNEKHGWIVGAGGTILRTSDGGENWIQQTSRTPVTLYHVSFRDEKRGCAVGERGTIVRTTDGGLTWSPVQSGTGSTLLSVEFVGDNDAWAVGRGGTILRTGDGGQTWVRQESATRQNLYALYFDKKNGWAVGGNGMVLHYSK